MSDKLQKIVDQVSELSVLEVAELVKALEVKFGVTASPVAVAGAPVASDATGFCITRGFYILSTDIV